MNLSLCCKILEWTVWGI